MFPVRTAVATLALFLLGDAAAQLPPTPDVNRYPELAAMKGWLEGGLPQARHCAVSAGLFSEASEFYRVTRSEPQTIEELRRRHEPTVPVRDRAQLQSTLGHVVGMAVGFATLAEDTATIAYSQLCIGRAKNPKAELAPAAIQARFNAAAKCEAAHAAGSLDRKECVAVAFRL